MKFLELFSNFVGSFLPSRIRISNTDSEYHGPDWNRIRMRLPTSLFFLSSSLFSRVHFTFRSLSLKASLLHLGTRSRARSPDLLLPRICSSISWSEGGIVHARPHREIKRPRHLPPPPGWLLDNRFSDVSCHGLLVRSLNCQSTWLVSWGKG